MDRLRIDETLKFAIMLKEYEDLRYTATCKCWLKDGIQNVYEHLKHLNDELATTPAKVPTLPEVATTIGAASAMDLHTSSWRSGNRLKATLRANSRI